MDPFKIAWPKACAAVLTSALVLTGIPFATETASANSYTVPNLLITEVTPDTLTVSGGTGTPDAYEFIELYNNTSSTINLKNYRIVYETPTVYTWTITTDKYIAPKSTFVVWIKSVDSATLSGFNSNYGTALTTGKVFEVSAGGLANVPADPRTISIANSSGTKISTVHYAETDVQENKGISYLYPTDGSIEMRNLTTDRQLATPGSVFTGQVPPSAWENIDPAAPTGFTAVPGAGKVTLSWNANTESDLAFYRIYKDGSFYHTYRKEIRSQTLTGLTEEQDYTFEVGAVDTSNNLSIKSKLIAAPLSKAISQTAISNMPKSTSSSYTSFLNRSVKGPIVPGLTATDGLVPQGMTYVPAKNWFLITHYRDDKKSSMITAVDATTGQKVKSMTIYNNAGSLDRALYNGHAGGITVTSTDAWISNADQLLRIPLTSIYNVRDRDKVFITEAIPVNTNASFVTYSNGYLWVGEFYYDSATGTDYPTDPSHHITTRTGATNPAIISAYPVDATSGNITKSTPDKVLSIPDRIQGIAFTPDGRIVLSKSYGRNSASSLLFYNDELSQSAYEWHTVNGVSTKTWFLDGQNHRNTLTATPLAQNTLYHNNSLYTLFESGAYKYLSDTNSNAYGQDTLMITDINGL